MAKIKLMQFSSLEKVFLKALPEKKEYANATALWGEEFSYQIAYYADEHMYARINIISDLIDNVTVRRVGNVPSELPAYDNQCDENYISIEQGLFPDVLYPIADNEVVVHHTYHSLWVSVDIDKNIKAGKYKIEISFTNDELSICESKTLELEIIPVELPEQRLIHTQWFHADCISSYYNVEVFSDRHWELISKFVKMAVDNGINMILTPIFTPPLDTQIGGERPTIQLVDVVKNDDNYIFNFDNLKKWIDMCKKNGVKYYEMSHLFTQWGAKFTPKIIATENGVEKRIFGWDIEAVSEKYKNFLAQFLPKLTEFLKQEEVDKVTYFHISDEPHGEEHMKSYKAAKEVIYEYIRDFKIIDALSDYNFYKTGLLQKPIPANNAIDIFLENNVPNLWTYYCCAQGVGVSNRFMAMPSYRNRIIAMQLYKFNIEGFLHWGYNFYYSRYSKAKIDPFAVTDAEGGFPSGDAFVVYPYYDGPIESIRLKVFKEALQDLRAMELLEKYMTKAEIIDLIEEEIVGEITFSHYPQSSEYILNTREKLNKKLSQYK
jgi:hypothetical protein